jgi:hypothetical protein
MRPSALTHLVRLDLAFSHGCLHILAADRDKLIEKDFLRGGVKMTIRPYDPAKLSRWGRPAGLGAAGA